MSTPTETERSQKVIVKAMGRWQVDTAGQNPYLASTWEVDDVGEYARGTMSYAIKWAIVSNPASVINQADLYAICEPIVHDLMLEHGAVWINLFDSENALADSEIQANAFHRLASVVDDFVATLRMRRSSD